MLLAPMTPSPIWRTVLARLADRGADQRGYRNHRYDRAENADDRGRGRQLPGDTGLHERKALAADQQTDGSWRGRGGEDAVHIRLHHWMMA